MVDWDTEEDMEETRMDTEEDTVAIASRTTSWVVIRLGEGHLGIPTTSLVPPLVVKSLDITGATNKLPLHGGIDGKLRRYTHHDIIIIQRISCWKQCYRNVIGFDRQVQGQRQAVRLMINSGSMYQQGSDLRRGSRSRR